MHRKISDAEGWNVIWASNTNDRPDIQNSLVAHHLTLQDDGNLVLYSEDSKPMWRTGTAGGCRGGENGEL